VPCRPSAGGGRFHCLRLHWGDGGTEKLGVRLGLIGFAVAEVTVFSRVVRRDAGLVRGAELVFHGVPAFQ
jgi:hypothetical protein